MKYSNLFTAALFAVAMPAMSLAATVESGATRVGDTGGINADGTTSTSSFHPAYAGSATNADSDWVWSGNNDSVNAVTYEFDFDLTGYDAASASLSGLWGVDNTGSVQLNGNTIASLNSVIMSNFTSLNSYGTSNASYFQAGMDTLTFNLTDAGGPAAFRATALVTADLAAVPLPASALLLLGGMGGIAGLKRMKKRSA